MGGECPFGEHPKSYGGVAKDKPAAAAAKAKAKAKAEAGQKQ